MKNTNVKSILFSLFAMLAVALAITACTSSTEFEEIVLAPQSIDYSPENTNGMTSDNETIESRSDCHFCSHLGASERTATSSYVYCYGNTGYRKTFRLAEIRGGSFAEIDRKTTTSYNTWFDNLTPGKEYCYNVITECPNITISHKKWTCFTN